MSFNRPLFIKGTLSTLACGLMMIGCQSITNNSKIDKQSKNSMLKNERVTKAYGRFVPERRDDFAWENDKVAFRVYGPAAPLKGHSSGVDAWFKKVDYSIIDKWYAQHLLGISYHVDHGEGYDPYHTGISRGVGATAVWIDGQPYAAHSYKTYKINENNGESVSFTLQYEWMTPIGIVKEMKTISLPLGSQLFDVNSVFTLDGNPAELPIAIGVATHDGKAQTFYDLANGHISAWETIDNYGVGTGALIDPSKLEGIKDIKSDVKDESHIWMFTTTDADGSLNYRAGFAWEGAGDITNQQAWDAYLDNVSL